MKVVSLLEAMPGVGKVRARQIMDRLQIAEGRRVRGLGHNQRQASKPSSPQRENVPAPAR